MWKIKTRIELPLRTSAQMLEQAVEAVVEARIPLIPVVATVQHVKFMRKMSLFQKMSEAAVGREQPFRIAAG